MSTKPVRSNDATTSVARVDMKLEVVVIPVSDVDRAKKFYGSLGWRLDVTPPGVIQFTPTGSGCSVRASACGGSDENWPAWYADYMVAEQAGAQLPT